MDRRPARLVYKPNCRKRIGSFGIAKAGEALVLDTPLLLPPQDGPEGGSASPNREFPAPFWLASGRLPGQFRGSGGREMQRRHNALGSGAGLTPKAHLYKPNALFARHKFLWH